MPVSARGGAATCDDMLGLCGVWLCLGSLLPGLLVLSPSLCALSALFVSRRQLFFDYNYTHESHQLNSPTVVAGKAVVHEGGSGGRSAAGGGGAAGAAAAGPAAAGPVAAGPTPAAVRARSVRPQRLRRPPAEI